jgi:hypothetical protein
MSIFSGRQYNWLAEFCHTEIARTSSECERLEIYALTCRLASALELTSPKFNRALFLLTATAGASDAKRD